MTPAKHSIDSKVDITDNSRIGLPLFQFVILLVTIISSTIGCTAGCIVYMQALKQEIALDKQNLENYKLEVGAFESNIVRDLNRVVGAQEKTDKTVQDGMMLRLQLQKDVMSINEKLADIKNMMLKHLEKDKVASVFEDKIPSGEL